MTLQALTLGRSRIGLGCMSFGGIFGATDEVTSFACLDAALAAGITHYDTANIYGMGVSETVLGRWIASRRPQITIGTKCAIVPGPPRRIDNSPAHIAQELDASLQRLGVDHVELYYLHRRDPGTPLEDAVGALSRLIAAGKIGGYGLSEVAPSTLRLAHAIHPCRAVQNEYSLWSRQPELGLIRACAELDVAFVAFSPLARGMFGETPVDPATMAPDEFRRANPRFMAPNYGANAQAIAGFAAFARSRGWTVAGAALAWVLDRAPHIVPIPGTRTAAHLAEWAGAEAICLTDADRAEIDRLLPPGFAHGDRYSEAQTMGVERYC